MVVLGHAKDAQVVHHVQHHALKIARLDVEIIVREIVELAVLVRVMLKTKLKHR